MLYKKRGYPDEGDIVLCTVTNIQGNSVFARMDEYDNLSGMIHVSEVSPGRIRNLRDFVREGKQIICKVLKTYLDRGHFDLSLRRVGEGIKRAKITEMKQEQMAEKIIELVAKKMNQPIEKFYRPLADKILPKYNYMHVCFEAVSKDEENLEKMGIPKDIASEMTVLIKQRIVAKIVVVGGKFKIKIFTSDGIDTIKEAFASIEKKGTDIKYLGAGNYSIRVTGEDYKEMEKELQQDVDKVTEFVKGKKGQATFTKEEIKAE